MIFIVQSLITSSFVLLTYKTVSLNFVIAGNDPRDFSPGWLVKPVFTGEDGIHMQYNRNVTNTKGRQ